MIQGMVGPLQVTNTWRGWTQPLVLREGQTLNGYALPMGGIFSGTSIEMPGNDALRLAMISDVPCFVDRLQIVICVPSDACV